MTDLTVITASVPGRERLLAEAMASVQAQTVAPAAHLIRVQQPPQGCLNPEHLAAQRNALLAAVDTAWTAVLDDDDLYHPHHVETILPHLDGADVVYTFAAVGAVTRANVTDWPAAELATRLLDGNLIPSNAAIRTEALRGIGGWSATGLDPATRRYPTGATWEDWDCWIRLARAGARFVCVPVETWDYRSGDWVKATTSWGM